MSHLDGGGQEQALIPARRPSSLSLSADVVPLPSKRRRLAPAENRNLSAVELGKLALEHANTISRIGWHRFFRSIRHRNCLHPNFTK